jgi:hypothetical protein
MCPPDCASLYVEVSSSGEELENLDVAGTIQPRALQALSDLGWLEIGSVRCSVTHIIRCAYVHHTRNREDVVANIMKRLSQYDVYPIGRYGLWDYISMEDSICSGISTVQRCAP